MGASAAGGARRGGGPVVGRGRELRWLVARLDEARVGVPQVVVVEGEPGIGKSRIVAAAAARAAERGTAVLTGRAYRHLSLPYLPLLDALFPALDRLVAADPGLEPDADLLRRLQGTGRAGEPAHRGRVLSGLTRLVFELARRRPLLLVVEDVHHADAATATLLRHLAFRMSEASGSERVPLAVVLTSWPWQADPELLALRREECCTTLALAGLDRIDTAALLTQLGAGAMAASTMEAVWRRTGGNPLYVEAVARDPAARLPAEIGAVVGERFAALDDGDAGLLAVAALLGPDCRLGVLGRVVGLDPAVVAAAAGRAEGVGIVRCDDDRLAFASPLYEAAAHDRLPSPARRNWHRRIAVALAGEPGDHVLAIARHLLEAGPEADAELVRRFAGPAGDRARAAFAWPDAAAFYEAAVRAAGPDPPAAAARLYHEAGRARVAALDWDAGLRNLDAAIAAYERAGDARGVAAAHLDRVRLEIGRGRFGTLIDTAPLEAAVARVAARDPRLAAAAMVDVSQALWMRGEAGAARRTAEKALARAEELADPATVARAANSLAAACWMTLDLRAAQAHLERARAAGVADGDPASLASSLHRLALGSVWLGDLARAEEVAAEALSLADRVNYPMEQSLALAALVAAAVARGDFGAAEEHAARARAVQDLTGYTWASGLVLPALATARVRQGRADEAVGVLKVWAAADLPRSPAGRAMARLLALWARASCGEVRAARQVLVAGVDRLVPALPTAAGTTACHCAAVELADLAGVPALAATAVGAVDEAVRRGEVVTAGAVFWAPRLAGLAAALGGRTAAGVVALESAADAAEAAGAAAEAALARADLARVLARRDGPRDRRRAAALATAAATAAADLGMEPLARRLAVLTGGIPRAATRARRRLRLPGGAAWRADAVVMFADVVDSTRLTEEWGDHLYRSRARELEHRLRGIVLSCGGTTAPGVTLGDGVLAVFPGVSAALDAALACAREAPETGLELRVGLHAGEVTWEARSAHGATVNVAARVCDRARPGTVLVSETVRDRADRAVAVVFTDQGRHELRGISMAYRLFEVVGRGGGPSERG